MIGGPGDDKNFYSQIKKKANTTKNVKFLGFVDYFSITKLFEESSLFVNTSISEGFPNTYLQAWANKVPTASLQVDPDSIIEKNHKCQ